MPDKIREAYKSSYQAAIAAGKTDRPRQPSTATVKEPPEELLAEVENWVKNWSNSSEGKATIERVKNADAQTTAIELSTALSIPSFQDILNKVMQYIPVKAVSIGVFGQAEIIFGVAGLIGYAVDLTNLGTTSSVFVGGGFVEGVDAGGEIAINLGFWTKSTSDITGFYIGASFDATDTVGVDGIVFGTKDGEGGLITDEGKINWDLVEMLFIGVDAGIEDGVDGDEFYFLSYSMSDYPTYQSGTDYSYMLCIGSLSCINSYVDTDVVYWLYTIDGKSEQYVAPFWNQINMTEPGNGGLNNWSAGNIIKFNSSVTITLHVGKDGTDYAMPEMTFNASDFDGLYNSVSRTSDTKIDVINEIKYTMSAFRVK